MNNAAQLAIVIRAVDQASANLAKVKGQLGGMGTVATQAQGKLGAFGLALGGIGKMALGVVGGLVAFHAIGSALGSLGSSAVGLNAKLEQSAIAWETMLGSAGAAQSMLSELKTFAAKTPFEFPELEEASKRLLAMGFNAQSIIPLMTDIGNASAALGAGTEGVDRMVRALGQMQAKTRVQTEELMQLQEMGVPALKLLADAMGVSTAEAQKMVTEGKVAASTFITAFQEFSKQNYGGLMEKQAKTFNGAMSTISDSLNMAIATAFQPLFEVISGLAGRIAEFVSGDEFQTWAENIAETFRFVGRVFGLIGTTIGNVMGAIGETVGGMLAWLGGQWQEHTTNLMNLIGPAWEGISRFIGDALIAIGEIANFALAALEGNWEQVWNGLGRTLGDVLSGIVLQLGRWANDVLGIIGEVSKALGGPDFTAGMRDWVSSTAEAASEMLRSWQDTSEAAYTGSKTWADAKANIQGAMTGLGDMMGNLRASLAGPVKGMGDFRAATNGVQMAAEIAAPALDNLSNAADKASAAAKQLGPSLQQVKDAMIALHPATLAAAADVAHWEANIASVNLAIQANQDQLKAAQAEYSRMSERLSGLNEQLSAAKQRLSDLGNVRLPGMNALDDSLAMAETLLKRFQLAATGVNVDALVPMSAAMAQFAATVPKTADELQAWIEQQQLLKSVRYDEQLRGIQQAITPRAAEMSFPEVLAAIARSKGDIAALTGAVSAQEAAMRGQQAVIESIQQAGEALNRTLQAYQANLAEAQKKQELVTQSLQLAYTWLLEDRTKFTELGAEGERIAAVMDVKAKELLAAVTGAATGTATISAETLAGMVANYQTSMASALLEVGSLQGALAAIPRDIYTYHHTVMLPPEGAGMGSVGHNAAGTPSWRGGLTWVGEFGPELVNLPRGSQVYSHYQSQGASGGGDNIYVTVNVAGSVRAEQDLVDAVTDGLRRKARDNGGRLLD